MHYRFIHQILILTLCALLVCAPFASIEARQKIVAAQSSNVVRPYTRETSKAALEYANRELKLMSLDEKIGQLISVGINASFLNRESPAYKSLARQVEENHIGGIILFRSPVYESAVLMNRMQRLAKRPLLISADLEAGAGMRFDDTINFPWNMALGASGDAELARRQGEITAREARALGVQQIFAPVVDVNNNADNPVINVRSYGEDSLMVGRLAAAFAQGAQSAGVIATAKHFPGHGDTAVDSHRGLPVIDVSLARLNAVEFVPFRQTIEAGIGGVMTSHIGLPQVDATQIKPLPFERIIRPIYNDEGGEVFNQNATIPATLSPKISRDLIRGAMKFDGLIVTDAMDMSGLTIYFDQAEAAVRAVEAGADMLLKPADADAMMRGIREAIKSGRLTEKRIEESARRLLAAKYDLGLVQNRFVDIDKIDTIVSSLDAIKLANEIAEKAITLVRDDANLLPLKNDKRIFNLVITNGDDRFYVADSFNSAMRSLGYRFDTIVLDERASEKEMQAALEQANKADIIIAALYGRVRTGQARSVGLPDSGARVLNELLAKQADKNIGISFGNPNMLMNFPALKTYLVAYGDMPSLQAATARAITGNISITGRLPITLPNLYARGTGLQRPRLNMNANATTPNVNTTTTAPPRDGIGEKRP